MGNASLPSRSVVIFPDLVMVIMPPKEGRRETEKVKQQLDSTH